MAQHPADAKTRALKQHGCLNPHAEDVTDELFVSNAFFDPCDLLQVKYEMLRRVREDGMPVSRAAATFGVSRPTWYQAQRAYDAGGLPALLPHRPGPRRAHKLTEEVLDTLRAAKAEHPALTARELVELVRERFGISVHRRSIDRALARGKNSHETLPAIARAFHRAFRLCARLRSAAPSCAQPRASTPQAWARHAGPAGRCGLAARIRRTARLAMRGAPARLAPVAPRRGAQTGDRHPARDDQRAHGQGDGMSNIHQKVTTSHLSRDAYLYVRQSTVRQVFENTESTRRQYALRERAVALGWPTERIIVIDSDLGLSGADSDREGFQHLVAEVGMGRAGIVLGLEVSRLARNSTDWHRLLEICALSETLILDEDGIYDPGDFNDRLLLGLKGTMSEAELHLRRARLRGGILNQARRGELKIPLPVGLVYDPLGRVVLDPDAQVQNSLRLLFDTFARTGSACATVKHFGEEKLDFPIRLRRGPHKGELHWQALRHSRALQVLHNPRYAGAFAFGRTRQRRRPGGGIEGKRLPREEWTALIIDAHPGYISWERFEANQRQLRDNTQSRGADRPSTAREGSALLQGLALCGVCGHRMTVRYHTRRGRQLPDYSCQSEGIETARAHCQNIPAPASTGPSASCWWS